MNSETFIPIQRLFSFSRTEKDQTCNRAGYLSREWGGTGLIPVSVGWDLVYGNIIHKWLDKLAQNGKTIDFMAVRQNVYDESFKAFGDPQQAKSWAAQAEGLLRAFVETVWPQWLEEYEILEPEAWVEYEVEPGFTFRARRDLLLVSKVDSHVSYREYKTTSTTKAEYFASYAKNVQLHTGMVVEKLANGREVRDGVVQTFYKGYKDKKLRIQRSPFAQGYINRELTFTPEYSVEYKRAKGWEMFQTFDEFKDLDGWMLMMKHKHMDILTEQLGRTAPIFPREDIAAKYFKQQMLRQREILEGVELLQKAQSVSEVEDILDHYWPQTGLATNKCQPAYGYDCEFIPICWQKWIGEDPLGSGLFERYDEAKAHMTEIESAQT